jgi:hypothetical protein
VDGLERQGPHRFAIAWRIAASSSTGFPATGLLRVERGNWSSNPERRSIQTGRDGLFDDLLAAYGVCDILLGDGPDLKRVTGSNETVLALSEVVFQGRRGKISAAPESAA